MELPPRCWVIQDELRHGVDIGYTAALMKSWSRKLLLVLALAVMPLQGIAATLSVLLCHGETQTHAAHAGGSHEHGTHQNGHHDNQQGDDGTTSHSVYHLCCHFTAFAPASMTLPVARPDFPARAYAPDPLHDLFVPDRPQRPPLA